MTPAAAPRAAGASGVALRLRRGLSAHPDVLVTIALAGLLVAVCFTMGGGSSLERTTKPEIVLTLLGAAAAATAAVLSPPGRRLWGGLTLLLFGALTALSAVSISWSIQPADTWVYVNLLFAYLGVFAGAMALVRIASERWSAILGAVVLAAFVVAGYSLVTKVFPSLDPLDVARVRAPFDYWNAVGLMAALGIPGCLWLGARRDGHAALRALSVPALAVLLISVLLSYGRGAIIVTIAVCALWFAIVPLRLRGAAVLGAATVGAAVVGAWALANDALSVDGIPRDVRTDAGGDLGLLLLPVLIVMLGAGLFVSFATSRSTLRPETRRGIGTVLLVLVALVPIAVVGKLATSDRGLTGSVSHAWDKLTDPAATQPGNDPSRLSQVGGVRARYWDDAFKIWRWSRLTGVGADTYGTARRPLQRDKYRAGHAHGYVPQTLADLGWIGLGVNLLLLVAWLGAVVRATALRSRWRLGAWSLAAVRARSPKVPVPRRAPEPWTAERIGLVTLATTAVAFGLHSAIDWTWFIPGTAITGLLCAAWVAGRGPLADPPPPGRLPRPLSAARGRLAAAAAIVLIGIAGAWAIWQPQRSVNAENAALDALDANRLPQAHADAEHAADVNPLSIDPLLTLSAIEVAQGRAGEARATLERAVDLQPANAEAWQNLGQLQLDQGDPRAAAATLQAAVYLDPFAQIAQQALAEAQAQAGIAPTTPAPPAGTPPAGTP
ncbi:Tetratricopeptide TPR_2 repeat protein [Conexibacter woesei DSM 14684]|uniref:Tetratricopeptide TPR_2 repeat protein n=1 Tax=Conexibacter woesei (strain DSM 14684 / CCUG 47730 / CIP 108061 / JCM 11494 / NBRC 100937 / ID131577) TaxID=469383 RepID=D3EZS9_CONWI|nr:Tetratricopeptide TPR_2 repeat protein [Conexibacter woesei DSM 14684]